MKKKTNSKNKSYLKKVLTYFLKPKKEFTIILIMGIFSIIISIIEPFITAKEYSAIVNINIHDIIKYTIIIFVIHNLSTILSSISSLISEKYSKKIEINIQKDITKELFKLEIKNFDKKGTDFFIERAISDSKQLVANISYLRYELLNILSTFGVVIYILNASI